MYDTKCDWCGTNFSAGHHRTKFCGNECRAKRKDYNAKWRKEQQPKKSRCKMCNKAFVKDYPQQRYCPRHN